MGATGIAKVAKTAEEQNAIRRANKLRTRKNGKSRHSDSSGFYAGLQQDRQNDRVAKLNARGAKMLDLLRLVMKSPNSSAHAQLQHAMRDYVEDYEDPNFTGSWKDRHERALKAALENMPEGRVRKYAKSRFDQIESRTRHMTR